MIKKLCMLFMVGVLVLSFSACSDGDSDSDRKSKSVSDEEKGSKENKKIETDDTSEKGKSKEKSEVEEVVEDEKASDKEKVNLIDSMDSVSRTTLNTFLSNFSEAYFENYPEGGVADNDNLLHFAFIHNLLNSDGKIKYNEMYMGMAATDVDETLYRFFGRTVPRKSVDEWEYMNDGFYMPGASGEFYAFFSIAKEMYANNDGTYTVMFDTFSDESNPDSYLSSWYSLTHQQALSRYKFCESGTAVVRSKAVNGKSSYELVSYAVK